MDDDSLNRDIESALNVDPSSEFVARVRTRIGSEPEPRRWRLAWMMAPIGAISVAMLAVLGIMRFESEPVAPSQVATPPVVPAPAPPPEAAARTEQVSNAPVRRSRLESTRGNESTPAGPQVLIAPEERLAFEYVVAMTSRVRVSETSMVGGEPQSVRPSAEDVRIAPITEITPLRIEPMPQIARLETGEPR